MQNSKWCITMSQLPKVFQCPICKEIFNYDGIAYNLTKDNGHFTYSNYICLLCYETLDDTEFYST